MSRPLEFTRLARVLIERAIVDLVALRVLAAHPEAPNEIAGFMAQQAVEKSLKCVLLLFGVEPPRTHDLGHLHELVAETPLAPPLTVDEAEALYPYAVEFRYDRAVGADQMDTSSMLRMATNSVDWARRALEQLPSE